MAYRSLIAAERVGLGVEPKIVDFSTSHHKSPSTFSVTTGTYPLGRREAGGETRKCTQMLVLQNILRMAVSAKGHSIQLSFDSLVAVAA